ncbi:uncharacterized protein PV07_08110 [Cladophialophora immunda]|uniref:Zn(2)-C6 fungal-type domain-containing protein n=1 Tax=Cladophialophora immunda TaxID=569365 RepID=A0A0D2CXX2_9EURO|nr:uncharacterized protein PV07_08110 [Cladophialophora immunda]KIW28444.1 hypothetical protein PV07_08110 [Cladophialophora immunda]
MSLGTSLPPSPHIEPEQGLQKAGARRHSSSQPYIRTRTGCRTCRDRKVKCDELRPRCEQCQRLQLFCEWKPRLYFRNDTPRILRQHSNVDKSSSHVWVHESAPVIPPDHRDDLPSFGMLPTNDQKEQKAGFHDAGTFIMVATPESFERLPEYHRSPTQDRNLYPLSPKPITSYRSPCSSGSWCAELRQPDPDVHMVRTSGDIHAFLDLEFEPWTSDKDPNLVRPKTGGPRVSVSAVVKGKENSLLADYGARIWRELAQATTDHLASYRWK